MLLILTMTACVTGCRNVTPAPGAGDPFIAGVSVAESGSVYVARITSLPARQVALAIFKPPAELIRSTRLDLLSGWPSETPQFDRTGGTMYSIERDRNGAINLVRIQTRSGERQALRRFADTTRNRFQSLRMVPNGADASGIMVLRHLWGDVRDPLSDRHASAYWIERIDAMSGRASRLTPTFSRRSPWNLDVYLTAHTPMAALLQYDDRVVEWPLGQTAGTLDDATAKYAFDGVPVSTVFSQNGRRCAAFIPISNRPATVPGDELVSLQVYSGERVDKLANNVVAGAMAFSPDASILAWEETSPLPQISRVNWGEFKSGGYRMTHSMRPWGRVRGIVWLNRSLFMLYTDDRADIVDSSSAETRSAFRIDAHGQLILPK